MLPLFQHPEKIGIKGIHFSNQPTHDQILPYLTELGIDGGYKIDRVGNGFIVYPKSSDEQDKLFDIAAYDVMEPDSGYQVKLGDILTRSFSRQEAIGICKVLSENGLVPVFQNIELGEDKYSVHIKSKYLSQEQTRNISQGLKVYGIKAGRLQTQSVEGDNYSLSFRVMQGRTLAEMNGSLLHFFPNSDEEKFIGNGLYLTRQKAANIDEVLKKYGCETEVGKAPDGNGGYIYGIVLKKVPNLSREQATDIIRVLRENGVKARKIRENTQPETPYGFEIEGTRDSSINIAYNQGRRAAMEDDDVAHDIERMNATQAKSSMKNMFYHIIRETSAIETDAASTASIAHISGEHITVGYLGDSPVTVYVQDGKTGKVTGHRIDRHPDDGMATDKINGKHMPLVHYLGAHGEGASHGAYICQYDISKFTKPGDKVFVSVTCDGLVEKGLNEKHYAKLIQKRGNKTPNELAADFVKYAYDKGSQDNLTASLVEVGVVGKDGKIPRKYDSLVGVFDGNSGSDIVSKTAAKTMDKFCTRLPKYEHNMHQLAQSERDKQQGKPPAEVNSLTKPPVNGLGQMLWNGVLSAVNAVRSLIGR